MNHLFDNDIVWTRRGKIVRDPLIVGRRISREWLAGEIQTTRVRFVGDLSGALVDLLSAANSSKKLNLPIASLRAALVAGVAGMISLERDLGLMPSRSNSSHAMEMYPPFDGEELERVRERIASILRRWCVDVLMQWAARHQLDELAERVRASIAGGAIEMAHTSRALMTSRGPDYPLVVRELAERLAGQKLFPGLQPCEIVVDPEYTSNTLELMTPPQKGGNGEFFSMVAKLSVVTVPYSSDIFLNVSASRRVWASRLPGRKPNSPRTASAYVLSAGRPTTTVRVERTQIGWEFGDAYAAIRMEAGSGLPVSLAEAISQRFEDEMPDWWVGLPQSSRLYDSLAMRTVFESDDVDLIIQVDTLLGQLVEGGVPNKACRVSGRRGKTSIAMIKLADVGVSGGVAGQSLELEDEESIPDDEMYDSLEEPNEKLAKHREQNIAALRLVHGDARPVLWSFCNTEREQELIKRVAAALFGDSVELIPELLPSNTHGLRENLPESQSPARTRFAARVSSWERAASAVGSRLAPRFVLICAPDQENRRAEDQVNYYAGLHAMCRIGQANVHHVLPIAGVDGEQSFVHRVQSALLDVFLAHSGLVFGVKAFVENRFHDAAPRAIYGIQAMRSKARAFSGERSVSFIVLTRLVTESGITQVQYVYKAGTSLRRTGWMPLLEGLRWLGSQRQLQGDEPWLKATFKEAIRDALADIGQDDPRAFVLIDWSTVAGLWTGIRDADLSGGMPPTLDGLDLSAAFPSMTFVRLRRGSDTLALRSMTRASYEGWKNGSSREATGESYVEEYPTTGKSLVEICGTESTAGRRYGHFLLAMGYSNTAQIKRGLSCYRAMPRMCKLKDSDANMFRLDTLPPGTKDASIPASMDVTVMHCPSDITPTDVATTVMGLRLGYAHYNDWTGLPAPLFFKRKIDDFVIRHATDEEGNADAEITDLDEVVHASQVPENLLAKAVIGTVLEGEALSTSAFDGAATKAVESMSADEECAPNSDVEADSPLGKALRATMPVLYTDTDPKIQRLYCAMIQKAAIVTVDLPGFARQGGLLATVDTAHKRTMKRFWDSQRNFGWVKQTERMPPADSFQVWLESRMRTPQAAFTVDSPWLFSADIIFPRVRDIFQAYFDQAGERRPGRLKVPDLQAVTSWVVDRQADGELAWLVFFVSQLPGHGFANAVLQSMRPEAVGPLSEEALQYFLDCAQACNQALEQKKEVGRNFAPIRLSRVSRLAQCDPPEPAEPVTSRRINEQSADSAFPIASSDPFMIIKQEIKALLDELEPGKSGFDKTFAELAERVDALRSLHEKEWEKKAQVEAALQALQGRLELANGRAGELAAKISVSPEIGIGSLRVNDIDEQMLDEAEVSLDRIEAALSNLLQSQEALRILSERPVATISERSQRNREEGELLDVLTAGVESLCLLVQDSLVFRLDELIAEMPAAIVSDVVEDVGLARTPEVAEGPESTPGPGGLTSMLIDAEAELDNDTASLVSAQAAAEAEQVIAAVSASAIAEVKLLEEAADRTAADEERSVDDVEVISALAEDDVSNVEGGADDAGQNIDVAVTCKVLLRLVEERRYALARVHVEAMGEILAPDVARVHGTVLEAALRSLDVFENRFSTDARPNPELVELLLSFPEKLDDELCRPRSLAVGIFGASLIPMLFEGPGTGTRWTVLDVIQSRFASSPALSTLATHIGNIDTHGLTLTREKFRASRVGSMRALESEIRRMQERAANWGEDADIFSNWSHRGFKLMHDEMLKSRNVIGQCLVHIANGDDERARASYDKIQKRLEKPSAVLEELARQLNDRSKLDGLYRSRMIDNIVATREFIKTYMSLIDQSNNSEHELGATLRSYFDSLHRNLSAAIDEIQSLTTRYPLEAVYCLIASKMMGLVLHLYDESRPLPGIPDNQQLFLIQLPMDHRYVPSMRRRKAAEDDPVPQVCEPWEVLEETRRLAGERLDPEDKVSEAGLVAALRDAARNHVNMGRFLPVFSIESSMHGALGADLQLSKNYARARAELEGKLHEARQRVVHAMALSALDKNEANRMQHIIAEIEAAKQAELGKLNSPAAYPDFPHAWATLRTNVLQVLDSRLSETKAELLRKLGSFAEERPEVAMDIERIRGMLASNSAAGLHTAHDAFAVLRRDGYLPPVSHEARNVPQAYTEFVASAKKLHGHKPFLDGLLDRLNAGPSDADPAWLAALTGDARADAADFVQCWLQLSHAKAFSQEALATFMSKAGIPEAPTVIPDAAANVSRALFVLPDRTFASENADDLFIPPVLGSLANHLQGYHWHGRPRDNDLRLLVSDSGSTPTLILAHTSLSLERRSKICREAPIILVDDDLVAYMAVHPDARLRCMMEIALLTFTTNPYADYGTAVPPEMFVGRQKELQKLRSVASAGVLYGGRRLGKTSLLDQITREMRLRPGHEAIFIQMDNASTVEDHVLFAWKTVYKAMVSRGIVGEMSEDITKWESIQEWIEREVASRQVKSCYLLIDEADALMGRELHLTTKAPSFVRGLQQLCERVKGVCAMRYVIAGLHNITRMTTEENSALGKADVIALEPFSSSDDIRRGIQLITRPLAALGFYFDRAAEDLPLRILSVCNFYPAFIQMYCNKLLDALYNKRQEGCPPTSITSDDLNAVETNGDLLADMQRKFELNLNLDKRYKAIALILADNYYSDVDYGGDRGMTVGAIKDCCEGYDLPHFAKTGLGTYEALLDEMQKLNVVERVGTRFVLRNPNIAMLMGDRERVVYQLDELSREMPAEARSHGERRPPMVHEKHQAVFPMPAAWLRSNIEPTDDELLILVGNNMSGIQNLTLSGGEWRVGQDGVYQVMKFPNPRAASTYLNSERRSASLSSARLVAVGPNSWKLNEVDEYASMAYREHQHCLPNSGKKRGVRLALLALPDKAYEIAHAISAGTLSERGQAAGRKWRIEPMQVWNDDALYFHLNENVAVADDQQARQAILRATCGFGEQIVMLCNSRLNVSAAMGAVAAAQKGFARDFATFYAAIGMPEHIDAQERNRIETFLAAVDGAERHTTLVDDVREDAGVSEGMFRFLCWMGLLQGVGHTWTVPALYRHLLDGKSA